MFKGLCCAVLVSVLVACSAPRPQPSVPQAPAPPSPGQPAANVSLPKPGIYQIDSNNSELRLLVYRAGPLSVLGHNHVMVNRALTGTVHIAGSISASSFSLSMPAAAFAIDSAQSRREEGSDFPGDIGDEDKSGTRHNMLSPAVLNAAEFPQISVRSTALGGTPDALSVTLIIELAGHETTLTAPFSLRGDSHQLWATGSLEVRQTAIGLMPYSLLHGALAVQDAMRVKFKIVIPIS